MARGNYWSSSWFADWLRSKAGIPEKLDCGTMEEWDAWEEAAHSANPRIHWFANTGINRVQDFFNWPRDQYHSFKYYLRNRFVTKTHLAPTKLERGAWHETEERMLHAMFQLLVDFVEVEQAWSSVAWGAADGDRPIPYWRRALKGQFAPWRSAEVGIKHFEWARGLSNGQDGFGQAGISSQAVAAEEIMHLYAWWTVTRPNRRDPWHLYNRTVADENGERTPRKRRSHLMQAGVRAAMDEVHRLEEAYNKEDDEKLIRLIKIRRCLWT